MEDVGSQSSSYEGGGFRGYPEAQVILVDRIAILAEIQTDH